MRTLFRKLTQIGWSFPIIVALTALCITSVMVIMSATSTNEMLRDAPATQFRYFLLGFGAYLVLGLTPYQFLVRVSPLLYLVGVALLVACFVPGLRYQVYGAHSWLKIGPIRFEPSEFVKLAYILAMAWFLRFRELEIKNLSTILFAILITAVPFILILKQPALGSASVFFPICFAMLFVAGARPIYLLIPLSAVAGLICFSYYWFHVWGKGGTAMVFQHEVTFLKPFQVERIRIFFDPELDPKGSGWQVSQSMIAIGSGGSTGKVDISPRTISDQFLLAIGVNGMEGKGWGGGTQTALGYLPKNTSYNDLIFSVVGELFGFRGGAFLIICEGTVLLWCIWVASRARDKVGAMVAVGVMAMLFTHIFVNIGMTIQVVPITGIPLPFMSYGGTFLVACLAAMGLVQSVWVHRINFQRA